VNLTALLPCLLSGATGKPEPEPLKDPMTSPARVPGLIQRYRQELQVRHYARRTVSSYEQWLRRFLRFHRLRHPRERGEAEINAFLSNLATEEGGALRPRTRPSPCCWFSTAGCWALMWAAWRG
jgi:hypothetical protein